MKHEIEVIEGRCAHCQKGLPKNSSGNSNGIIRCPFCEGVQPAWHSHRIPTQSPIGTKVRTESVNALARPASAIYVACITFNEQAELIFPLSPVSQVPSIKIKPSGGTNGVPGLDLAYNVLFGDPTRIYSNLNALVMSDGDFNSGGGPEEIEAQFLKDAGVKIGSILYDSGSSDANALRKIATSTGLFFEASRGDLAQKMLNASRTMSQTVSAISQQNRIPGTAFVFILDASGSMAEGSKKEEAERAFALTVDQLQQM